MWGTATAAALGGNAVLLLGAVGQAPPPLPLVAAFAALCALSWIVALWRTGRQRGLAAWWAAPVVAALAGAALAWLWPVAPGPWLVLASAAVAALTAASAVQGRLLRD